MTAAMQSGLKRCNRGFTLLELLVVLVIIGILASFVTLTVGTNPVTDLEREAQKLKALTALVQQESMLAAREMAIDFNRDGYGFWVFEKQEDGSFKWVELEDDENLYERTLPENMSLTITLDDEAMKSDDLFGKEASTVRVFMLSSGEMTPFEANLELDDGPAFVLTGDLIGNLTLEGPI